MSVLVVSKILTPFGNTLTHNDKYSLGNREILKKPIEIEVSEELKVFSHFLLEFISLHLIFKILKKNISLIHYVFPKL